MDKWGVLVLSLPTENATARMRAWRSLKAAGVAVLRDGVYLLPMRENCIQLFKLTQDEVQSCGGSAYILHVSDDESVEFPALFNRTTDYAELLTEVVSVQKSLTTETLQASIKQLRKLRKTFSSIVEIDYFPGEAKSQTETALEQAELQLNRLLSPNEPHASSGQIVTLELSHYRGRKWATRKRPWVDRLASAWLIRKFIDKNASFIWLDSPHDCPVEAIGFDFDGATFSHLGSKVTFEVLLTSFALEQPALQRLGRVIHYLDAGGIQPEEAVGLEQILWGLRNTINNDDQLLTSASSLFDALLTAFTDKVKQQ